MTLRFKGFTLLEILVTVAIIAIITTIAVVATQNVRLKARDTNRISNVNQVVSALEQYYTRNNTYPTMIVPGEPIQSASTQYLPEVPQNPRPRTDGGCLNNDFHYDKTSDGYQLTFCLGSDNGRLKKGVNVCINGNCLPCEQVKIKDLEGNEYTAVSLGGQCWMAENLRTKLKADGTCINGGTPPCPDASPSDTDRRCYDNNESACATGALYTPAGIEMDYDYSLLAQGPQGICPSGWHIPTETEWKILERHEAGISDPNNESACAITQATQYLNQIPAFGTFGPFFSQAFLGFICQSAGDQMKNGPFNSTMTGFYKPGGGYVGAAPATPSQFAVYWSNYMGPMLADEEGGEIGGSYGPGLKARVLSNTRPTVGTVFYQGGGSWNGETFNGAFSLRCVKNQ